MGVTSVTTALRQDMMGVTSINTTVEQEADKTIEEQTALTQQHIPSVCATDVIPASNAFPTPNEINSACATATLPQNNITHSSTDVGLVSSTDNQNLRVINEPQSAPSQDGVDSNAVVNGYQYIPNGFTDHPQVDTQDEMKTDNPVVGESLLSQVFSQLDVLSFFEREHDDSDFKLNELLPYIESVVMYNEMEDGAGGKDKRNTRQAASTSNTQSTTGGGGDASAGNTNGNPDESDDGTSGLNGAGDGGGDDTGAGDAAHSEPSKQCLLCMEEYPTRYSLAVHVAETHPVKVNVTKLSQVSLYMALKKSIFLS